MVAKTTAQGGGLEVDVVEVEGISITGHCSWPMIGPKYHDGSSCAMTIHCAPESLARDVVSSKQSGLVRQVDWNTL